MAFMPPTGLHAKRARTLDDVVASVGCYPIDAYHFIHEGLHFAAERAHGEHAPAEPAHAPADTLTDAPANADRHITGRQLCEGLRDLAVANWGLLARTVLGTWHVTSTGDFGRIVFAMIDAGLLQKQPGDTIDDFADVFEFRQAFDARYAIHPPAKLEG